MSDAPTPPPPTTTRSWRQLVLDADPDFQKQRLRYTVYEFSSGRKFESKPDPYSTP